MLSLTQKFELQILQKKIEHFFVSDLSYAKKRYQKWRGEPLNLEDPKNFSEKLQYLKLYYRNPLMRLCSDKLYAREYVKACGYAHILKYAGKVCRQLLIGHGKFKVVFLHGLCDAAA